ncbi:MAG TPA: GGDEF domain-containing protein [Limnochordia bacterium]|nr:GGDEF domain-containing protein [Limnochordia bacterium]
MDDFKGINDQRGHMVGDAVLKEIAARATGSIRKSDILARWGGDEFTILLPDTDLEEAQKLAERVRSSLLAGGFAAVDSITCSFGATAYEPGDTKHSLLRRVDDLLRQAKCCGKDRVVS